MILYTVLPLWMLIAVAQAPAPAPVTWRTVQPGVTHATLRLPVASHLGDSRLHVVRVDPRRARLRVGLAGLHSRRKRTLRWWLRRRQLSVATNLGMFARDHRTHVGYTRVGKHVHNPRWRKDYLSAFAFDPRRKGLPAWVMVDLDRPGAKKRLAGYRVVIQNLRLIKEEGGKGVNVWTNPRRRRRWSEAALAMDGKGRVLFLFCRSPYRMIQWNDLLLRLPLDIRRAQHLEGGPEASLSVVGGGLRLHLMGSFESRFAEHDGNRWQFPLPNVLGVVRAAPAQRRRRSRRRRRPRRRRERGR